MKDRIRQLIETKPYKNGEFAELLGINPAGISHILSGRNNPGYDLLKKILTRFPNVSADWLLLGEGPMLRQGATKLDDLSPSSQQPLPEPPASPALQPVSEEPNLWSATATSTQPQTPPTVGMPAQLHARSERNVARVIICYEDGTFDSFTPDHH